MGGGRPIEVEVSQSPLSSDAGLLVFRPLDERVRYTAQFAAAMSDTRSDPTHSRFENAVTIADLWRLRSVFVDLFLPPFAEPPFAEPPFAEPPPRITLDWDAWDDATHGQQQLTLFHGHDDQYQYYPLSFTCAENDQHFNRRRHHDALGEGHLTTWRTRIIKVAAEISTSTRRIVIRLSATWPHLEQFLKVAQANVSLAPT